jgi:4-hydroxy-tetrahydrodipicolinate reductase
MRTICLIGSTGKMGKSIQAILENDFVIKGFSKANGDDFDITVKNSDVVIDFSHADNVLYALKVCMLNKKPYFCGTTNLNNNIFEAIKSASKNIPVMYASNTSFGIAVLKKAVQLVTKEFGLSADIEISETHHRAKKDAPSGTALSLGEVAACALGYHLDQIKITDRAHNPRDNNVQIGFASMRGGSIFCEHTVHFLAANETIKLSHACLDRKVFAEGAVKAALWLCNQSSGFYTMEDMLN